MSLRSKWAAGWGSVAAYWRIGVWRSKTAFRHGYNDQEVSAESMMLYKRGHADTPIRFPSASPARIALKNSQLTCGDITIICETVH
jgi:hypothetical protein